MNQKGFIHIVTVIAIVTLAGAVGYVVVNRQASPASTLSPHPISPGEPIATSPGLTPVPSPTIPTQGQPMTIVGDLGCLPTTDGREICIVGLRGTDGRHYGLNLDVPRVYSDPEAELGLSAQRVEIRGIFTPEPLNRFTDVEGVIYVTWLKIIPERR